MSATANHTEPTQAESILTYLKNGHVITDKDARQLFGCGRLSARIFELRRGGHEINSNRLKIGGTKTVGQYWMPPTPTPAT